MDSPKQKLSDEEYIKMVTDLGQLDEVEFEAIVMSVRLRHRFLRQKAIQDRVVPIKKKIILS